MNSRRETVKEHSPATYTNFLALREMFEIQLFSRFDELGLALPETLNVKLTWKKTVEMS